MKKVYCIAVGLLINVLFCNAQEWHSGKVTLNDGRVFSAQLNFDPFTLEGLLKVKDGELTKTYSSNHVSQFTINENNNITKFYSLSLAQNEYTNYTRPYFLEILFESHAIALFARDFEFLVEKGTGRSLLLSSKSNGKDFRTSKFRSYFMISPTDTELKYIGTITHHGLDRGEILMFFKDRKLEVKKFIKDNKLRVTKIQDLKRILAYYSDIK